ncbi:MAG TPA: DUF305 domain-containing protein, partial [Sporichthya sp.]|nr:DUF305 domain-containing protein [Sporichthya sp.]
IEMATLAVTRGSANVRALATTIQLSQARESGVLRGWLHLWGAPQLSSAQDPDHEAMSGMAGRDELTRLAELKGHAFDVLFLQLMVRHHQGAVAMAQGALRGLEVPAARETALAIVREQTSEIAAMKAQLTRLAEPR